MCRVLPHKMMHIASVVCFVSVWHREAAFRSMAYAHIPVHVHTRVCAHVYTRVHGLVFTQRWRREVAMAAAEGGHIFRPAAAD